MKRIGGHEAIIARRRTRMKNVAWEPVFWMCCGRILLLLKKRVDKPICRVTAACRSDASREQVREQVVEQVLEHAPVLAREQTRDQNHVEH